MSAIYCVYSPRPGKKLNLADLAFITQRLLLFPQVPVHVWSLMGGWSRGAVLELYRALLRAGRQLQYTDRNYYRRAVAHEFRRCQDLKKAQDKEEALKRGQFFLDSRLGGLMSGGEGSSGRVSPR